MASLQLKLLGGFEASSAAGRPVEISGKKNQALLAYLATHPGRKLARDKLTSLLWSDRGEQQARGSLRQALLVLKEALEGDAPGALVLEGDSVGLEPGAVATDVAELEALARSESTGDLRRAAELYGGDLLDGLGVRDPSFEDWLAAERTRLREVTIGVLGRLTASLAEAEAVAMGQRLVALDPLREASHRALMRAYAGAGEKTLALQHYARCRDLLRTELGVAPARETEELRQRLLQEEGSGPAPGESAGAASAVPAATLGKVASSSKPSIAVLPFTNMSGDPEQEYFSDGVTEDIITELSRFRSLLVIARHSSFQYRGRDINVRRVGRELNVDYIIEGSIRRSEGRLRITAQLIDAKAANHIWAERYDRDARDLFGLQEEIAQAIASTAGARVEDSQRQRAVRADAATLEAYDLFLRAKAVNWMYSREANRQALTWTERAIHLDPTSAPAHAYYAMARFMQYVGHWTDDPDAALRDAHRYSRKAVELDDSDVDARGAFGQALLAMRKFDEAGIHLSKGVELNPNNTEARCWYGMYLFCVGQYESAIDQFEAAKRRNPIDLAWMPWLKGGAYFTAHRYAEAIASFNQIVDPIYEVYGWLAASYAQAGQLDKAHEMLDDFLRGAASDMAAPLGPKLADWKPYWRKVIWYQNEADYEHLFQGLRLAGLPE